MLQIFPFSAASKYNPREKYAGLTLLAFDADIAEVRQLL